jgi:branched-chain amino acid aminotransferase
MRGAVFVNGKIAPADQAVVPVYDHGFVYGEGVYETMRTYNRVPFLYDRHMRRLRRSAERILLDVPFTDGVLLTSIDQTVAAAGDLREAYVRVLHTRGVGDLTYDLRSTPTPTTVISVKPFEDAAMLAWIDQTIDAAGDVAEAYVRVLHTRGVGDLTYDLKSTPKPTTVIIVKPFEPYPARVYNDGIRLALVDMLRNHPRSVNPIIKSNNLMNNALAMQAAYRSGAEEALMCNYRGELTECSQSNFFLVRNGAALTPTSEAGLLEGVTRAFLFELGREIGVDVREETLFPEDLETADEMFITSTTRELSPVVNVDGRPVGDGKPGPITTTLTALYQQRAQELTRALAAKS